jgi:hypothetical protein
MQESQHNVSNAECNPSSRETSTEESFKCSQCGDSYPTDGLKSKECPVCGRVNKRGVDKIVFPSNEGY